MDNLQFLALCLALVCSSNEASAGEEDAPDQVNLEDIIGVFGRLITAMTPKEKAEEIHQLSGLLSNWIDNQSDSDGPVSAQQQGDNKICWNSSFKKHCVANDNSQYLKVSSTGQASFNQSEKMGIYRLQETRRNHFPVWKKLGAGENQYLFVSTDGYWGIGPDLNCKSAGVYLPQNDPTPKSPINAQGWLYLVEVDQDWEMDDTIRVEVFTGVYEINSFGAAAEQKPSFRNQAGSLMGSYLLTTTILNDFPVYEKEDSWWKGCMFVDSQGFWTVGGNWETDGGSMFHPDNDPTPGNPPSEGWLFLNDDDEWQSDPTLTCQYISVSKEWLRYQIELPFRLPIANIYQILSSP